ncbi:MAG: hypothetical protein AAGD32_06775 [Planctomycetota bacterium]
MTRMLALMVFSVLGCATESPERFSVDSVTAEQRIAELREMPVKLERPVVILDGFLDPGVGSLAYRKEIREITGDDRVLRVAFFTAGSLAECRDKALAAIEEAFPGEPVDIIGISMGGAVAFFVADTDDVEVERIFTLSSPLRGASLANLPTWMTLQKEMRPGSDAMNLLAEMIERFDGQRVHYAGVSDKTVKQEEAAPAGESAYVLPNDGPARFGHTGVIRDPRVRLDIFLRLRDAEPITKE